MKITKNLSLLLLLTALLTSCSTPSAPAVSLPDIFQNEPEMKMQIQMPESSSCILYVNQEVGFTMELPLDWAGKVMIEENPGFREDSYCIAIRHREIYEQMGGLGSIFVIDICPGQWSEDDPPMQAGWSRLSLQTDTHAYFVRTPSGVEYPEDNEQLAQEYLSMRDQLDTIKDQIHAIERVPAAEAEQQPHIQMPENSSSILYVNQEAKFTMELPLDWTKKVMIMEYAGTGEKKGIYFIDVIHQPTNERAGVGCGTIFCMDIRPGQWSEDNPPVAAGWSRLALQTDTHAYFVRTPSDVQYLEDDEQLSQEYLSMQDELDTIKNQIHAIKNVSKIQPALDASTTVEPPLQEADWDIAVPDFLTEEQQLLYRKAYNLYNLFLGESASVDSYPMPDGSSPGFYPIKETMNGVEYYMAQGRYRDWDTFLEMVHSVYTDELFELLNQSSSGNPIYVEQNGTLFYLDTTYITHPGKLYNETFELVSQTDDEIIFLVSDQFYEEITDSVETRSGFVIMKCINGRWFVNEFGYPK